MKKLLVKLGKFETHHQIIAFSLITVATIVIVRVGALLYDPNPTLFKLELHHFDYGVLLLLVTVKLLLFGSKEYRNLYLFFAAVSSALIIDGYLALRLSVVEDYAIRVDVYKGTMTPVLITVVVSTLSILFINSIMKKR